MGLPEFEEEDRGRTREEMLAGNEGVPASSGGGGVEIVGKKGTGCNGVPGGDCDEKGYLG